MSRWLSTNELGGNCQGHWKGAGGTISGAHMRSGIVSVPTSLSGKTFYYAWSHTMQRSQENITSEMGTKQSQTKDSWHHLIKLKRKPPKNQTVSK